MGSGDRLRIVRPSIGRAEHHFIFSVPKAASSRESAVVPCGNLEQKKTKKEQGQTID
jgi:hypothetical protein